MDTFKAVIIFFVCSLFIFLQITFLALLWLGVHYLEGTLGELIDVCILLLPFPSMQESAYLLDGGTVCSCR